MTPLWTAAIAVTVAAGSAGWLPGVTLAGDARYRWHAVPLAALLGGSAGLLAIPSWDAVLLAIVAGAAALLVVVDIAEHRLPDTLIFGALGTWLVGACVLGASTGSWSQFGRSVLAAAALFGVFLLLGVLARGMLGFGDVKLSVLMGAVLGWFGWAHVLTGVVAGVVLHGFAALGVLIVTRDLKRDVPMGPALVAGAALALAWGGVTPPQG